jgi:hypothetical protein
MPRYSSGHGFDEPFISVTGIASFVLVVALLAVLAFVCVDYVRSQQSIGYLRAHEPQMMAGQQVYHTGGDAALCLA